MIALLARLRDTARCHAEHRARVRRIEAGVLVLIVLSVLVLMADSVPEVHRRHGPLLSVLEWTFTALFTMEYLLRLWLLRRPWRYARSFFGVVDLLSILPVFLALLMPGLHVLADVRLLRLLRLFRILQLPFYLEETRHLRQALVRARRSILVFIGVMVLLLVLLGTVMFLVEGPRNGFNSIPTGVYWAAVTMSTTGYGDLTPQTALGRFITGCAILLGYGIIAFPTGLLGAEIFAGVLQDRDATATGCRCSCHRRPPAAPPDP
ncbi:potassium channel family protein [Stenotrophomonas sp. WHRI 8082]|uniref:potassium channel family protein n=1 Tax=Stenotrophomonas sp. WHRI 8082 TaxID=3162571 RepID=UPI0032ECD7B8